LRNCSFYFKIFKKILSSFGEAALDVEKNKIPKITCIVPVYNESKTIGPVLDVLTNCKLLNRIIVINDGSTDNSLEIIKKYKGKIEIINHKRRKGKGQAVREATEDVNEGIIFFCDADLIGLKEENIKDLVYPLLNGYGMSVGVRDEPSPLGRIFLLYGERMMWAKDFQKIRNSPLINNYGLETVMNEYCKRKKIPIAKIPMKGVIHLSKPKKWKRKKISIFREILSESVNVIMTKLKLLMEKNFFSES